MYISAHCLVAATWIHTLRLHQACILHDPMTGILTMPIISNIGAKA